MTPSSSAPQSDTSPPPKDTTSKSYLESAIEAAQGVLNTLADRVRGMRPADDKVSSPTARCFMMTPDRAHLFNLGPPFPSHTTTLWDI